MIETSVVIATFNGEQFLKAQLNSIINQTVLPTEIIISDDGSTDNTLSIIQDFIDKTTDLQINVKCVQNDSGNHGVTSNFENAIRIAEGKYVFLCDQDDIWLPNKIERAVEILDGNEESKVLIHNAEIIQKTKNEIFVKTGKHLMPNYDFDKNGIFKPDGNKEIMDLLHLWGVINGMCIVARKDFLDSILPLSKGGYHDQWILFCGFLNHSVVAVKDDLAYYRIHDNNTVGIIPKKRIRSLHNFIGLFNRIDNISHERIKAYYVWYKDTMNYMGQYTIPKELSQKIIYYTDTRLLALSTNKIKGLRIIIQSALEGIYKTDGGIVFVMDLLFLLLHRKKYRMSYINTLNDFVRDGHEYDRTNGT